MEITVQFEAQLRHVAGVGHASVAVPDDCSVTDALQAISAEFGPALGERLSPRWESTQRSVLLFVNEQAIPHDRATHIEAWRCVAAVSSDFRRIDGTRLRGWTQWAFVCSTNVVWLQSRRRSDGCTSCPSLRRRDPLLRQTFIQWLQVVRKKESVTTNDFPIE